MHLLDVAVVIGECDVAGLRVVDGPGGIDGRIPITRYLTANPVRQLTKHDGHGSILSSVVETSCRSLSTRQLGVRS
jgi:hypothetical protein